MRLVLLTHAYPRWPGDVAGSFLGRLADALAARGHTLVVVAPADRGKAERFTLGGADVVQVRYAAPEHEHLAYTGDMLRAARSLPGALAFRRLVRGLRAQAVTEARRIDADLLHAFWWVPGGWSAVGTGLPTVISLMGTDVALLDGWIARRIAHRVLPRARRLTALSTFLAERVRTRLGLPDLAIDRVPVPADTTRFVTRSRGGGGIVYLGRLSRQKRVHLLLEAVAAQGLTIPVTIVGDGPERAALERQAAALGLGNVRFTGYVEDDRVIPLIQNADVAAFLSHGEGLGLAAAEMLMLGIPVVATTDGGGVADLMTDGRGARVVAPEARVVGAALAQCAGDAAMRAAAQAAGEVLRGDLTPEAIAATFETVYERVR